MAVTASPTNLRVDKRMVVFQWAGLTNGNAGKPYESTMFSDKSVHIFGTFGLGGSVTIYGSNDPNDLNTEPGVSGNWVVLTDPQANAITKTALAIEQILENPLLICPKVTAGDGTTAITVTIAAKGMI